MNPDDPMEQSVPQRNEDEFGDLDVFSEARLEHLKTLANTQYKEMSESVLNMHEVMQKTYAAIILGDEAAKRFNHASKTYASTLKAVWDETQKVKF